MIEFDNMELFNLIWRDTAKGICLLVLKIKSLTDTYRHSHTYRHSLIKYFYKIYLFQNQPLHLFNNRIHFIKGKYRLVE